MTGVEVHFRLMTMRERIEQLEGEAIAMMDQVGHRNIGMISRVRLAGIHLSRAAEELRVAPSQGNDLETLLQLSIAKVREQKQCQNIGGVLPFERNER